MARILDQIPARPRARRIARLGPPVLLAVLLAGAGLSARGTEAPLAADPAPAAGVSAEDRAALSRANAFLNDIGTLRGRFEQLSETGLARGTFYMSRPGKLRFEYDPPAQIRFIVDGTWVGIDDIELETVNRYPLSATPLKVLLAEDVDLGRDTEIVAIEHMPGQTRITLRKDDGAAQGELTLVFSRPDFELQQWVVTDAQGTRTSIRLAEVEHDVELSPSLFVIHDYSIDF
ncbi:MAG: outer membrane lipoprotein carrier protein LolA [Alphaproteobacteria bacterium]|nr:outer membrane lipoprotein carrier protein LolA [Alphaproteobacteria bacterium]